MIKALEFEILRGIASNGRISLPLERRPARVATILNEEAFNEDHLMVHHHTVFLEDQVHDWDWKDGRFRYYSRVAGPEDEVDVLIVYELDRNYTPAPKFCSETGRPLGNALRPKP